MRAAARACGARGVARPSVAFNSRPASLSPPHRSSSSSSSRRALSSSSPAASASSASASSAAAAGAASWPLLYRASKVASFSGLCYVDTSTGPAGVAELERRAAAMGLHLVAHGRCAAAGGTSWVVGDATIDYAAFARRAGLAGGTAATTPEKPLPEAGQGMPLPLAPPARRERFVLLRGVQWGAADADVLGLSAALAQVWPAAYPREGSELVAHAGVARLARALRAEVRAAAGLTPLTGQPSGRAAAAAGAPGDDEGAGGGWRAGEEDDDDDDDDQSLPVVWAGHSLGGALAKLLWVAEVAEGGGEWQRRRRRKGAAAAGAPSPLPPPPPLLPEVLTFGSPPVLAHARGGGSAAMMRALAALAASSSSPSPPRSSPPSSSASSDGNGNGSSNGGNSTKPPPAQQQQPPSPWGEEASVAVAQYVLDGDPVPRALLSADPTFASLRQNGLFSAALRLNQAVFGAGSPLTPQRFLFEPLGVVKLVRWSPSGGSEVVPLAGTAEEVARGLLAAAAGGAGAAAAKDAAEAAEAAAAAAAAASGAAGGGSDGAGWSPLASLRAWLDHHHGSYTQELEAAAISALRAEQRAAALQRQQRRREDEEQQQQRREPQQQQQQQQQAR